MTGPWSSAAGCSVTLNLLIPSPGDTATAKLSLVQMRMHAGRAQSTHLTPRAELLQWHLELPQGAKEGGEDIGKQVEQERKNKDEKERKMGKRGKG